MHMCWGTGFLASPRTLHRGREADTRVRSAQNNAEGAASGRARMRHGLRPPGPARGPSRRRLRAVRPVPEPAAAAGAARDRLRQGLRAGRGRVPVRRRRQPVRRLPGRLRRVRGRAQPPGDPPGAARRAGRPAGRLDPVRLRAAARAAGRTAAGQGPRAGAGVLLQQRHRGGGVRAEVRPLRHRPRPHPVLRPRLPRAHHRLAVGERLGRVPPRLRPAAARRPRSRSATWTRSRPSCARATSPR